MQAGFFSVVAYCDQLFPTFVALSIVGKIKGNLDFVFGMANFSRSLLNCHIRWILIRIID